MEYLLSITLPFCTTMEIFSRPGSYLSYDVVREIGDNFLFVEGTEVKGRTEVGDDDEFEPYLLQKYPSIAWEPSRLVKAKNFQFNWVLRHPKLAWTAELLASSRNFDITWVEMSESDSRLNLEWDMKKVTEITLQTGTFNFRWVAHCARYEKEWDFDLLAKSPLFNIEWCTWEYTRECWDCAILQQRGDFDLSWFEIFPEGNWDTEYIANHGGVSQLELVMRHTIAVYTTGRLLMRPTVYLSEVEHHDWPVELRETIRKWERVLSELTQLTHRAVE